jgi:hypothetical protein
MSHLFVQEHDAQQFDISNNVHISLYFEMNYTLLFNQKTIRILTTTMREGQTWKPF